jgi:Fe-S cluster assembly protein SufD
MTTASVNTTLTLSPGATPDVRTSGLGPAWLEPLRERSAARFAELGVPTPRDEAYRFTSLKPFEGVVYASPGDSACDVTEQQVRDSEIKMDVAARLVTVDGVYQPALSDRYELPDEVVVKPMSEAIETHRSVIEPVIESRSGAERDPFVALNGALMDEGVFVHVPAGVRVAAPIVVRHLSTAAAGTPIAKHPRSVVVVEAGGSATIVEHLAAREETDAYLTNLVTDVVVGDDARAEHYLIERESSRALSVCTRRATLGRRAHFESHSCLLGAGVVRNNVEPTFDGEDADAVLNGVYIAGTGQHMDNAMWVQHNEPHCRSRQYFKGLLTGEGRGVFTGRIFVARKAQLTDAVQSSDTLLLSDDARSNARPQLEIYADDVKCTHGATVGQLDEQALFYLRQRGLTPDAARAALVQAFAQENIDRMGLAPVRAWLTERVLRRLPGSDLVVSSMHG